MKFEVESLNIVVSKHFVDGEPSHWSVSITEIGSGPNGEDSEIGEATGPTFASVWDSTWEIITGDDGELDSQHNEWVDFDANAPK